MTKSIYWWALNAAQDTIERLDATQFPTFGELEVVVAHDEDCPCKNKLDIPEAEADVLCNCDPHVKVELNPWTALTVRAPRPKSNLTKEELITYLERVEVMTVAELAPPQDQLN